MGMYGVQQWAPGSVLGAPVLTAGGVPPPTPTTVDRPVRKSKSKSQRELLIPMFPSFLASQRDANALNAEL